MKNNSLIIFGLAAAVLLVTLMPSQDQTQYKNELIDQILAWDGFALYTRSELLGWSVADLETMANSANEHLANGT